MLTECARRLSLTVPLSITAADPSRTFSRGDGQVIPWRELSEVIEHFNPKPEGAGRPPASVERMLSIHFFPALVNLSESCG